MKFKIVAGTVVVVAVMAVAGIGLAVRTEAASPLPPGIAMSILLEKTWRIQQVTGGPGGDTPALWVYVDTQNPAAVKSYIHDMRQLGPSAFDSASTVDSLVLFREPVSIDRFEALMQASGARPREFQILTVNSGGGAGLIGGAVPATGPIVDRAMVGAFATQGNRDGERLAVTPRGVVTTRVALTRAAYQTLAAAPEALLVDTSAAIAVTHARRVGNTKTSQADVVIPLLVSYVSRYDLSKE